MCIVEYRLLVSCIMGLFDEDVDFERMLDEDTYIDYVWMRILRKNGMGGLNDEHGSTLDPRNL